MSSEESNRRRRLKRHIDALAKIDPDVAAAVKEVGYPLPRVRPAGFETFLSVIVSQQISVGAARAIFARVVEAMGEMSAEALLACKTENLRAAGLSGRKVEYAVGMAERIVAGEFDPDRLEELDDETAISEIVAVRGFGRWSAEIYLMFSLGRADVFPADDLALQVGLQRLKKLDERPTAKQARGLTEHWAPRRSAGSLFLWHFYKGAPT